MNQSHRGSLVESLSNQIVGITVCLALYAILLPALGHNTTFGENLTITAVFMFASFVRTYILRRLFNSWASTPEDHDYQRDRLWDWYGYDVGPQADSAALFARHAEWSNGTFGSDRGPVGSLKHLIKEAEEAIANPTDSVEYADCLLLVFDAARRSGLSHRELIETASEKLEVNKHRKFKPGDADEPSFHVTDAEFRIDELGRNRGDR